MATQLLYNDDDIILMYINKIVFINPCDTYVSNEGSQTKRLSVLQSVAIVWAVHATMLDGIIQNDGQYNNDILHWTIVTVKL